MNVPNRLTVVRLALVPVFVALLSFESLPTYVAGYLVFVAAAVTDWLDGRIARGRNLVTNFGKLMDPLADKVLMASAFVMMMRVPVLWVPGWTVVAILAREFLVTGARSMAASSPGGAVIAASMWGKVKTVLQMAYVCVFLFLATVALGIEAWSPEYAETYLEGLRWSSLAGIVFVALFTLYTGVQFAQTNWKSLHLGSDM